MSIDGHGGSLAALNGLARGIYIHINNTNPIPPEHARGSQRLGGRRGRLETRCEWRTPRRQKASRC
jgi:hypothetical protein